MLMFSSLFFGAVAGYEVRLKSNNAEENEEMSLQIEEGAQERLGVLGFRP